MNQEEKIEDRETQESPFRKGAIDQLISPEQLDRAMIVVKPKGWIALITLACIMILAIVWAFLGSIPIEVKGKGIILSEKGLFSIYSTVDGIVAEMPLSVGDWVSPKSIVAKIYHKEVEDQVREQERKVEDLSAHVTAAQNLDVAASELAQSQVSLEAEKIVLENLKKIPIEVDVYSSSIGKIIEIGASQGGVVSVGTPLAWALYPQENKSLVCHAFFSVADGEQVRPGMDVKMALEGLDPERYGYLLGKVFFVSEFPVSDLDILQVLRNAQLIDYVKQGQATVIAVLIHPILDSSTPSGFKWSSESGPNSYVKIGSISNVRIVIEDKKPISYLFPYSFKDEKKELGINPNVYPKEVK